MSPLSIVPKSHSLGVWLVLGSAVAFSFAGVLTKLVESGGWTVVCWRGLFGLPLIILYVLWRQQKGLREAVRRFGWRGWLIATVASLTSAAFIASLKMTFVANVVIIYATVPFVAAAIGWLTMREGVRPSTLIAALGAFLGVTIMVGAGTGSGHFAGDVLALLMTVLMAVYMVLVRVFRETPVVLATAASSLQLFLIGCLAGDPLATPAWDIFILALFGLSFALGVIMLTEGVRLIPAAEAGLLGTADTPLAIALAWLFLSEVPPSASIIGGTVVLAAVFAHAGRDLARPSSRRKRGLTD